MNRTYTGNPERETAPQTAVTPAPQAASLNRFTGSGGDVASAATGLQRATGGRLARAGNSLRQLQRQYGNRHVQRVVARAAPARNQTGLPTELKTGVESLSGLSLDDVSVHYNSPKPAQVQALAYTQGTDIHVAPGQEQHVPHEAWHVVQQKKGRVRPTIEVNGTQVNDDPGLEKEADRFSSVAQRVGQQVADKGEMITQAVRQSGDQATAQGRSVIQRAVGFELEVDIPVSCYTAPADAFAPNVRPAANDWANAQVAFPEAAPHALPPVPQTVIYTSTNGGETVDAVPDKRRLAPGMPRQILEIRVNPIDTANIAGLAATMGHVQTGINHLYNGINAANPQNNRFHIPIDGGATAAMVGLPHGNDPTATFNNADRGLVTWQTYMQATAGIRSNRLRLLHRKIRYGAAGGDDPSLTSLRSPVARHRQIATDARDAALGVYNNIHANYAVNPDDGIPAEKEAVLGFLTLICTYLLGGAKAYRGQGNLNPKNLAALFSRSGFDQIRTQTLSPNSEQWIRNNRNWFRSTLVNATRSGDADDRLNSPLFNRLGMAHPTQNVIIFLNDALSGAQDRYTHDESKVIIPPENVGVARPGAVLEFRNIANPGNAPAAWIAKMQEVITAIHHINT